MAKSREDLLQALMERMMLVTRLVRHNSVITVPLLSPPLAHVLFTVAMHKKGISVKELSEHIGVTPGAVTQFVNNLAERGLILREIDANDRRIVRLKLSRLAKEHMEQLRKDALASAVRVFEEISDEDIQTLIDIFSRIDASPVLKQPGPPDLTGTPL